MEAVKENRVYTITEADVESFKKEGFDIYDDGKLVAYGTGKTIAYDKYAELVEAYEKLMSENAELSSQVTQLEADIAELEKKLKKKDASKKKEE